MTLKEGSANRNNSNTQPAGPVASSNKFVPPVESIVPNVLLNFVSYSPLWTLAAISPEQFNDPSSYRNNKGNLKNIIFSSAGRFDKGRTKILDGSPEYFLDNFSMRSIVAPTPTTGNQNVTQFTFDVYEPYSAGKLLESMQVAALASGYVSYLDNCPYLLQLDFKGYGENNSELSIVDSKYFVLRLTRSSFTIDEAGSKYKFEAAAYNHMAYTDNFNITYTDLKITGVNVGEICEKLTDALNANEKKLVKEERIEQPDVYKIEFPKDGTDDKDSGSPIKSSEYKFDAKYGGNFKFASEAKRDAKTGKITRDNLTINPKLREFHFAQQQSITSILTQLVLESDYARKATDPKNDTGNNEVNWFKIDVQMEINKPFDGKTGDYPYKIKYRIVPFKVHRSIFDNFTSAYSWDSLTKKIVKKYNYIYSGQNVDVLKFNIEINNLFYVGTNPNPEQHSAQAQNPTNSGASDDSKQTTVKTEQGGSDTAPVATAGRRRSLANPAFLQQQTIGGSGQMDPEALVAKNFHQAFLQGSSADLVNVELEILGDPYWLVDSGMANYFAKPANGDGSEAQTLEDGTANFVGADIYIYFQYRTPMDVNTSTGLYDFPNAGIGAFTGIYKVTEVENIFLEGVFKQKLTCVRMIGQYSEFIYETAKQQASAKAQNSAVTTEYREVPGYLDSL